jgi:hypothetical protein
MRNWYKISQTDIQYLGYYNLMGANFVKFKIGNDYWAYKMDLPEVYTVRKIALRSPGKALAWAKKNKSEALKVTKDFPAFGSIIREETETLEERAKELGKLAFLAGANAVPSQDHMLMELLQDSKVGDSKPLLEAWLTGWNESNLAE